MSVSDLMTSLREEAEKRVYFSRFDVLEETFSLLKARLYISPSIFVQIYRNDRFNTTNFVLIYDGERIFARDQLNGTWHRHLTSSPDTHDTSDEGLSLFRYRNFSMKLKLSWRRWVFHKWSLKACL